MIVVAGGGVTGLATGFELDRLGRDYTILEAAERPGGVVRSGVVNGRVLDWGPQRARLTPAFRRRVEELDLAPELLVAPSDPDLYIYRDGRLRRLPFSVGRFLISDIVSLRGKLRAMTEPIMADARPDERVADFFSRKFGRELYETVIGPLYGGLYASDPADMEVGVSLIHVLRDLGIGRSLLLRLLRKGGRIQPPRACTFREGMQTLTDALARRAGDRLRTETPIESLEPHRFGWRVRLAGGEFLDASEVVLTTPAPVTAALLRTVAPLTAAKIGPLRYNPLAVVHVEAETDLEGVGFKVAYSERALSLTGVTFNHSLFGRPNVYTAYLGGARNPEVQGMDDDELATVAVRDFRTTTGFDARVLAVHRAAMPAWDLSWRGLREISLPPGVHVAGSWWSRPGLPGRFAEAAAVARSVSPRPVVEEPALAAG